MQTVSDESCLLPRATETLRKLSFVVNINQELITYCLVNSVLNTDQRAVRHCLVFTLSKRLQLASLFPVKCPWNQVFYISIKVLSLCSLALSMAIITMAPNSLIMPTPNIIPLPLQTLYRAHAPLSWTLASSPQPPCSQSERGVWHHQSMIGCVALGVSMGGIDEIPQGRPGTARLLLNPELPVSNTLSEHDKFLLRGSAAMVEPMPPAMYRSLDL